MSLDGLWGEEAGAEVGEVDSELVSAEVGMRREVGRSDGEDLAGVGRERFG